MFHIAGRRIIDGTRFETPASARRLTLAGLVSAAVMLGGGLGCSMVEDVGPRPQPVNVDRSIQLDVPAVMRGTVASQAIVLGFQPVIVRGYGLVVGLSGNGSRDMPPSVRSHMLAQAALRGFGDEGTPYSDISPEDLLNSMDTAVVVVEAVVPPGATAGTRFDVRVYADPRTGTTSLEGGRLYTTDLRPGQLTTGRGEAARLATAHGDIFVNPFSEPGPEGTDTVNRLAGRILNGGVVTKDLPLKLRLTNPSHAMAEVLQNSINARFPKEPGQREETARGESDEQIKITVPPSYRNRSTQFVQLVRHMTIRLSAAEATAVAIRHMVQRDPDLASAASWRWQSLGPKVLPVIQVLYDYPEELPRMAALSAGAALNDALVVPHLLEMTTVGSKNVRRQAIELLGEMGASPMINRGLRELLNDDDVDIRLDAYEALVQRFDPYLQRRIVEGKYVIDIVPSDKPTVYITQLGLPRIVIFGRDLALTQPLTVLAWSNRLIIKGDIDEETVEVFYRPPGAQEATVQSVKPKLSEFVAFLGHTTTIERPEPGLGLTYGEAVGALHQIWKQEYLPADFKAEQDRILAAITRQQETEQLIDRPEFSDPDFDYLRPDTDGGEPEPLQPTGGDDLDQLLPTNTGATGRSTRAGQAGSAGGS